MAFQSGSVSWARFRVEHGPDDVTGELLDTLAAHAIGADADSPRPEMQAGFTGPRHVFDTDFDPRNVAFGSTLLIGMRLDTNTIPAEIRRAYRTMAIQTRAAGSVTGYPSRRERQEAKEEADERCRREVSSGRHQRSKLIPILWDVSRHLLLAPIFSETRFNALRDLLAAAFDLSLEEQSSGAIATGVLGPRGLRRELEDAVPSAFTAPPMHADGDAKTPLVPWTHAGGGGGCDFLGNEFIIWLWHRLETDPAAITTPAGEEIAVLLDRSIDMDCAWDATGKMTLTADRALRLPEATAALLLGKWPRKVGMMLAARAEQWAFTFQADRFLITGCKVPAPEDTSDDERAEIERRIASITALDESLMSLFNVFLTTRFDTAWPAQRDAIRAWIAAKRSPRAPAREAVLA